MASWDDEDFDAVDDFDPTKKVADRWKGKSVADYRWDSESDDDDFDDDGVTSSLGFDSSTNETSNSRHAAPLATGQAGLGIAQELNKLTVEEDIEVGDISDDDDTSLDEEGLGDEESSPDESSSDDDDNDVVRTSPQMKKCIENTKQACDNLYINAPRIDLNLMHDFTESDLFTIDGDSILADIFTHQGLDLVHGGQLLHFVYLVEHFLQDFHEREGQFHIVFFTDAESLWHSDPLKLLARRVIIQHLAHNTNTCLINHIPNPFSLKWKEYVETNHPAFVMLSDGESLKKRNGRRMLNRCLLMSSVKIGLDVAFCSAMERSLRSVNTFYVEARKAQWLCRSNTKQQDINAYAWTTQILKRSDAQMYSNQDLARICGQFQLLISKYKDTVQMLTTSRDIITVFTCAEILRGAFASGKQDEMDRAFTEGMTQACVLHCVLLQYLPLESRAQNLPDDAVISPFSEGLMKKYLRRLHYSMARVIASYDQLCKHLSQLEAIQTTETLADLMDGRLLHVVLYILQNFTENDIKASYPTEVITKFKYLWQLTLHLSQVANNNKANQTELPEDKILFGAPVHIYDNTTTEMKGKKSLAKNRRGLVKVSSQLATDYAGDLLKELSSDKTVNLKSISARPKQFIENYHWHSGKPLKDDYENTMETEEQLSKDPRERKKQLERKQKHARYMQNYGESLEGRARGLRQQTITVEDKSSASKNKKAHQGQKKTKVKSVREKILEEKLLKDQEKADADAASRWASILPDVTADMGLGNKYTAALKNIDNYLSRCQSDRWTVEALLAKMDCYWLAWRKVNAVLKVGELQNQSSLFSDLTASHPMYYAIMLFVCCQEILDYQDMLSKKQLKMIAAYIRGLGFTSFAQRIDEMECRESANSSGSTKPIFSGKLPGQDECSVGMSCTRFQLQFVGQWMKRDERSDKDPRVSHFIPDTWQRELLNVVDRNESALIVAPTSSGKTYASYYCMEKVLRQGNDGVVVYVSPTKALMNQVSATLYARFTKKLPPGKVICGVFSRDFRTNALNCQILVTVPQCLEILLLSPCRQEWAKRIQYVVFDEVHCLGGEIGAEVWEHLLVAINCPFLALSATVRNPQDIRGWLQESQDFKQKQAEEILRQKSKKKVANVDINAYKVKMVVHKERHSDLEKYIYVPAAKQKSLLLPNDGCLHETKEFVALHPVAMLNLTKVKAQGLPADLSLSPREALVLYDVMYEVMKAVDPDSSHLKALDPEVYFQTNPVITKKDARDYENDLKKQLMTWIEDNKDQKAELVIDQLKHGLDDQLTQCKKDSERRPGGMYSDRTAISTYAKLVRQLNEQHKLPALVFSQNRKLCENLADAIASSLEDAEDKLRTQFENSAQCKEVEKIMERLEKQARRNKDALKHESEDKRKPNNQKVPDDSRSDIRLRGKREKEVSDSWSKRPPWRRPGANKKGGHKSHDVDAERFEACVSEADPNERKKLLDAKHFLLDDPLPSCTLQGEGNLTKEEIDDILYRLPEGDLLCRLILRGVAYHHAGLNQKQRVAVETLFRMKHLKVVSATATLALGIHMPCKTVVFVCEDLWLKPLSFRQMSGRSGRRGFDLVGNVIFHCVPEQKIQHLITSGLPHLRGHFPFSVSLVLRLMVLTHNSADTRNAHEKALALLKHPFVCHKAQGMEEVVQHFFLFSVDYLIRVGLLEADGTPIGLSGLATHLHYHEPANLTFVSMLQEGAFHRLCVPNSGGYFSIDVMETLVLILAQMFGRKTMSLSMYKRKKTQGIHSKVVFAKDLLMPPEFSSVLKRHNKDVMKVFMRYVHTVCDYAAKSDDTAKSDSMKQNVLPLSKIAINPSALCAPTTSEDPPSDVMCKLRGSANQSSTLSPFVMTSGNSDDDLGKFHMDISQAIRQGVHIESSKIPTLLPPSELRDNRGKRLFINAYAYDFFKHGSSKIIEKDNGLDGVHDRLKDFKLVIAAISVALDELGPESDNVVNAFRQLKQEYADKFKNEYGAWN